ncbi:MarR family winged helix-turn-helix transcriptional regulator [Streptomyces sp. NPDC057746]|uniref:MarR family winged helix-turn-helix transcriptional regulator n=1 Tax=Streptomyces sp. NPDC057746 TaxID=3346237 RepID=UPI0036A5E25F
MPDDLTPASSPSSRGNDTPEAVSPPPADRDGIGAAAQVEDLGIVDSLAQLSFLVQAALGGVAAEHGLSIIQLRLLGVLRDRTPGMQELARHLGLDKSSMTGLVDRAERRDLVRRTASPHDRRAVLVALTPQGHELVRQGAAEADRRIRALAAHLTDAQRSQLSRLASALVAGHMAV